MINWPALTSALQRVLLDLEEDLRGRVERDAELRGRWMVEHSRAAQRGRTASSWVAWRDDRVTQAAVAWVLTTVFVRFCEDNALVGARAAEQSGTTLGVVRRLDRPAGRASPR